MVNPPASPSTPRPRQSNSEVPIPSITSCGSSMVKSSWPLARISRVTLDNSAPGAKANSQSALARWPVSGAAPTASKVTHPVSLLPCSGHVTPLGSACAETTGVVKSGPMDMSTIRTTMERARWRRGPRRSPFRVSFMRCGVFFTYLKGSLRCLYNAQGKSNAR